MSYFTRPYSRGRITLASADPFAPPHIDFNYGHDERALLRLVAAIKRGREVFAQSAFDAPRLDELKPGAAVQSDAELLAWVRQNAETRSEEHTSELQSLMRISYAVFRLKKTK